MDLQPGLGLVGQLLELLVRRRVVVLRPVVDLQVVLQRLAGQRVGADAVLPPVPPPPVDVLPQAARAAPARRARGPGAGRADGRPRARPRGAASRASAWSRAAPGCSGRRGSVVVMLSPPCSADRSCGSAASASSSGAVSSHWIVIGSPGWIVSCAASAPARCSRMTICVPPSQLGDDLHLVPEVHLGVDHGARRVAAVAGRGGGDAQPRRPDADPHRLPRVASPRPRTTTPVPASTANPPSAASVTVAVQEVHVADEVGHERRQRPVVDRAAARPAARSRRST